MAKENEPINWTAIEVDYRAGIMSIREIARWHGISHPAIIIKAKAKGWERKAKPGHVEPLEQEVRARRVVAKLASAAGDSTTLAERARNLAGRMIDELDTVTAHHGELEDMIHTEESDPRRRGVLLKAISLGERAMTLKNISQTLKTLSEAGETSVGKKANRQAKAEKSASGGKFAVPSAPNVANPPGLAVN